MIPIKLSLQNFMSYRDNVPPLSFEGIHTACISGDNGNGKSTLVDAITWALWGKTRAKGDDDLVNQGQSEMTVEFDFVVGEQVYRIIRKHARPRKIGGQGRTLLELQIADRSGFRTITGNTIAQTQQSIIGIVHMDYHTFVNSALLLQGQADAFTVKRPLERKQVLADILGLSFYDELEERAKERSKEKEIAGRGLESAIKDITAEVEQKPSWQAEFDADQVRLCDIEKRVDEKNSALECIREKKTNLEIKKQHLEQLNERIAKTEQDLSRWNEQMDQHLRCITEYQGLLEQSSAIEEGYRDFTEARAENEQLNEKLVLLNKLSDRKHTLEMNISRASQSLLNEHAVNKSRIQQLKTEVERLPSLEKELLELQAGLQNLEEREKKLNGRKKVANELVTGISLLESKNTNLGQEIKEVEEKLALLHTQEDNKCPLCETELAADGMNLIEEKYAAERQRKCESLMLNKDEIAEKRNELEQCEKEITGLEAELRDSRAYYQGRKGNISQEISRSRQAKEELRDIEDTLDRIEGYLARKEFSVAEQQILAKVEKELADLEYSSEKHEAIRQRLVSLEKYEGLKRRLEEAEKSISREKEAAGRAKEAAVELNRSLENDNRNKVDLIMALEELPQVIADVEKAAVEFKSLMEEQKQAQEALWALREKLKRCEELDIKLVEKEKMLSEVSREEDIYRDLALAFGKRGVQSLIIESALPEIEIEANKLLGNMTDNRMHIKMETQRGTKSGSVVETLDIKISDELGTRSYEMYSGGEAFRINFGTQDSVGIEKIKEAINSIQDDFDKILVITHMEELRDAFPNRIEVKKTASGSTFEVN
jgi:exonuclease SbcC